MTVLGIDLGASTTDFVLMEKNKILKKKSFSSENKNFYSMLKTFPINRISGIKATGCFADLFEKEISGIPVQTVNEIKAIGTGAKFVSGKNNVLAVSLGSGTAFVSVKNNKIKHVGGTAIGGKTLLGLSELLLGINNVNALFSLAKKGNLKKVDLTLKEIYPKGIGLLDVNSTASHFGSLKNPKKSDIALALINMVSQSIGSNAVFAAKSFNHSRIVFGGKLSEMSIVQKIIKKRVKILDKKIKFVFSKNSGIQTAIGALMFK